MEFALLFPYTRVIGAFGFAHLRHFYESQKRFYMQLRIDRLIENYLICLLAKVS